jgi:iron complex outermembrane receptor protein
MGRSYLATTVAFAALLSGLPSAAQAQSDQPAAEGPSGLEEIVVTARRKDERLQTVPLSVSAVSGKELDERQIVTAQDLERLVPSLNVNSGNSRDVDRFSIRGQGTTLFGDPGVIAYFAEVPLAANGAGPGFFFDLSNVQVLNGPQGTLFGRNTTGGAVLFEPQHPTNNFEGWLEGDFGNYANVELKGAVNVPIVGDKLMVRVAFDRHTQDGFTTNIRNGKDLDNVDYWAGRVGVTFRPVDNVENYLLYFGEYSHTNGTGVKLIAANPSGFAALFYPKYFPAQALADSRAEGIRQVNDDALTLFKTYNWGIIDTLTWDVTDWLTFKNIAAYQETKSENLYDLDGTPFPVLQGINSGTWANTSGIADAANYTEEAQISGKLFDDKLSYQLGGFLEYDHPIATAFYAVNVLGSAASSSIVDFGNDVQSHAVYTQETYDLSGLSPILEGFHLTAGFRYTWDYKSGFNDAYHPKSLANIYAGGNCSDGRPTWPNCFEYQSSPFRAGTYTVQLDYQLNQNIYLYFTARSGFKSGGFNFGLPAGFTAPPFGPEKVHDEELGIKTNFDINGVKTRFNLDLFDTDYSGAQRQIFFIGPSSSLLTKIVNGGNATIQGVDLQSEIVPVEGLVLRANYTYQKAIYDYFDLGGGFSAKGQFMPNSPRHNLNLSGTYHLPMIPEDVGDIALTAAFQFQTTNYQSDVRMPGVAIPTYGVMDLRVDWTHIYGYPVDISFYMNNALDRDYEVLIAPYYYQVGSRPSIGVTGAAFGPPREWGFTVRYTFGGGEEHPSAPAEPAAAMAPAAPAQKTPKSYLVFFDFDKSALTPEGRSIVDQAAANAEPAHVTQITVTGHTDTVGSDAYNMRLSRRRAESVAAELEAKGISSNEITLVAKGKRDPLVPTGDGVREPQNRRVEIVYGGGPSS